jgi:hypothetical protein
MKSLLSRRDEYKMPRIIKRFLIVAAFVVTGAYHQKITHADELLINGGFETGDLTGWTTAVRSGSAVPGTFFVMSGSATPVSGLPTVGQARGEFYAVSDSEGAGTRSLLQAFTVPAAGSAVFLSFDLFVNNWAEMTVINSGGLDHTNAPNQHARVDILSTSAMPFDIGADALRNFYLGADLGFPPNPYRHYGFDITDLVGGGGVFQIRFAEVDTEVFLNMGVDNVSITTIPEPTTLLLVGTGFLILCAAMHKRDRKLKRQDR